MAPVISLVYKLTWLVDRRLSSSPNNAIVSSCLSRIKGRLLPLARAFILKAARGRTRFICESNHDEPIGRIAFRRNTFSSKVLKKLRRKYQYKRRCVNSFFLFLPPFVENEYRAWIVVVVVEAMVPMRASISDVYPRM